MGGPDWSVDAALSRHVPSVVPLISSPGLRLPLTEEKKKKRPTENEAHSQSL